MPLKLMYFTNNSEIARTADVAGVDRIVIDLETLGKQERQGHLDTRISAHQISDIGRIRQVLVRSELLVRINPINPDSQSEIESVVAAGADIIMLPYFKTLSEINTFLRLVNQRTQTILLLETAEAEQLIDEILQLGGFDAIHIGINDLAISKGLNFLFESLLEPSFETLCAKLRQSGIPFGFGGISRLNEGRIPARYIIPEHYRLGSTMAILSRSFLSASEIENMDAAKSIMTQAMQEVRDFEQTLLVQPADFFRDNSIMLHEQIQEVVTEIKAKRSMISPEANTRVV